MRHSRPRIFPPRRRPSSYHSRSAIMQASTASAMGIGKLNLPAPASAPAASSSGSDGMGRPNCSTNTQANSTVYPCSMRKSMVSRMAGRQSGSGNRCGNIRRRARNITFGERLPGIATVRRRLTGGGARQEHGLTALQVEELLFQRESAAVTAERAVGGNHAMAGHDDGDGIVVVGRTDGAEGLRPADGARLVGVGAGLAVGNLQKRVPAAHLEIGSAKIQGNGEV